MAMALTEEQRAKLNAKAEQKRQAQTGSSDYDEYQEFLRFKEMKRQQEQQQAYRQNQYTPPVEPQPMRNNFEQSAQQGFVPSAKNGGISKKAKMWIGIFLGLCVLCMAYNSLVSHGTSGMNTPRSQSVNTGAATVAQKETKQEPASIEYHPYTFGELVDELNENALRAETNHNSEYVIIEGYISNFDSDGKYFSIDGGPDDDTHWLSSIHCNIASSDVLSTVFNLNKKDRVVVVGQISSIGEVLGYTVDVWHVEALPADVSFTDWAASALGQSQPS